MLELHPLLYLLMIEAEAVSEVQLQVVLLAPEERLFNLLSVWRLGTVLEFSKPCPDKTA